MKYLLIVFSILAFTACKCSKATSSSQATSNPTTTIASVTSSSDQVQEHANQQDPKSQLPDTIRLLVSFISIGEGTDHQAPAILDGVIQRFFEDSGKKINYVRIPWGREGEQDYCFNLNELDPVLQTKFIEDLRVAFKDHTLVQVAENKKNRFKR